MDYIYGAVPVVKKEHSGCSAKFLLLCSWKQERDVGLEGHENE